MEVVDRVRSDLGAAAVRDVAVSDGTASPAFVQNTASHAPRHGADAVLSLVFRLSFGLLDSVTAYGQG